jgi:hypothetical protein
MRADLVDPPVNPLIKVGTGQGEALTDLRKARPEHIFGLEGGKALASISGALNGFGGGGEGALPKAIPLDEVAPAATAVGKLFKNDLV